MQAQEHVHGADEFRQLHLSLAFEVSVHLLAVDRQSGALFVQQVSLLGVHVRLPRAQAGQAAANQEDAFGIRVGRGLR